MTTLLEARERILKALIVMPTSKSGLGRCAYPEVRFRCPQAAAFSVAKVCASLIHDGLIRYVGSDMGSTMAITDKGRSVLDASPQPPVDEA